MIAVYIALACAAVFGLFALAVHLVDRHDQRLDAQWAADFDAIPQVHHEEYEPPHPALAGAPSWADPQMRAELAHDRQPAHPQDGVALPPSRTHDQWQPRIDVTSVPALAGDTGAAPDAAVSEPAEPAAPPHVPGPIGAQAGDSSGSHSGSPPEDPEPPGPVAPAAGPGDLILDYGQDPLTESGLIRALDWETIARMDAERGRVA